MKNKLIFRILGALASALIITSVFVPFISVAGNSISLWDDAVRMDALYLPIIIIVFGAIGVIFFALNIKTEFAYMSAGAITFFGIVQTVDMLNQNSFEFLSIGYYFLVSGAILTALMAFLTNLKSNKKKDKVTPVVQTSEPSMLDQINKLYNEQPIVQDEISPVQPINNIINPIPIQSMGTYEPIEPVNPVVEQSIPVQQPVINNVEMPQINLQPAIPVQPMVTYESVQTINPVIEQSIPVQQQNIVVEPQITPVNPVNQDFVQPIVNPVVQEFSPVQHPAINNVEIPQINLQPEISVQPKGAFEPVQTINPVIEQPIPVQQQNIVVEPQQEIPIVNPVIQEFTNPGVVTQQNPNDLDIFGQ